MPHKRVVQRRILLLLTNHTYRAPAFLAAAERLGIEVVKAQDMPRKLAEEWGGALGLDYANLDTAVTNNPQPVSIGMVYPPIGK